MQNAFTHIKDYAPFYIIGAVIILIVFNIINHGVSTY